MRRRNEAMLEEVHRLLAEEEGIGAVLIARRLEARGLGHHAPSTVHGWLVQLERERRIDSSRRVLIPPLYSAYLLLDLPEPRRADVRRVIAARDPNYAMDTVTGIVTSTIIRTSCRQAELARIREECLANGALDAKALLVLRSDRRTA